MTARKKKPRKRVVNRGALKNAMGLYKKFREADPKRVRQISMRLPEALMVMGRVSAIEYETTHGKTSQGYRHDFHPGSRPTLADMGKRNGLYLLGGRYRVTERGIVDLDPRGREIDDDAGEFV